MNLEGAHLLELAGGRNKQEVKRGFAVVERTGTTRYFIVSSSPQFSLWTREIQRVVDATGISGAQREDEAEPSSAAKASLRPSQSQENKDLSTSEEFSTPQRRRFGSRLAATKTRIGSALETARLKGIEVSERRRLRNQGSTSIEISEDSFEELENSRYETQSDLHGESPDVTRPAPHTDDSSEGIMPSVDYGGGSSPVTQTNKKVSSDELRRSDSSAMSPEKTAKERLSSEDVESSTRGRIGSKLAGVGMVTKSRIGSAIQTARQRGKEVVERRKLNSDDAEEKQQGRVRGRLRGLLSATPEVPGEAFGSNDSSAMRENDASGNLAWTCIVCTFINNSQNLPYDSMVCEMCGSAKPSIESKPEGDSDDNPTKQRAQDGMQAKPDQTITNESVLGDEKGNESTAGEEQIHEVDSDPNDEGARRGLFSGIRNARNQSTERSNGAVPPGDNRRAPRFAFRKRLPDEESWVDETPLKLKNLRAGSALSSEADGDELGQDFQKPVKLRRLVGQWAVVVRCCQSQQGTSGGGSSHILKIDDDDDCDAQSKPKSTDSTKQAIDATQQCEKANEVSDDATLCSRVQNPGDFWIKVVCGDSITRVPPAERFFHLEDLLELHTRISECVSLTLPQLREASEGCRDPTGEMSHGLSIRLGLSSFDNVMVAGRMLGGLLDCYETSDIAQKTRDYQGALHLVLLFLAYHMKSNFLLLQPS